VGLSNTVFQWTNRNAGTKLSCSAEPVFVNLLRSPRIDSQPGRLVRQPNLICRTGPPSYISRRNRFLGIDSWVPLTFTNTGSGNLRLRPRYHATVNRELFLACLFFLACTQQYVFWILFNLWSVNKTGGRRPPPLPKGEAVLSISKNSLWYRKPNLIQYW
jgi:hypothetical protein